MVPPGIVVHLNFELRLLGKVIEVLDDDPIPPHRIATYYCVSVDRAENNRREDVVYMANGLYYPSLGMKLDYLEGRYLRDKDREPRENW